MTKKRDLHLVLRDRLLRQTKKESNPYRRIARAVLAGNKIMRDKPGQGPDVERALFHVCCTLARKVR